MSTIYTNQNLNSELAELKVLLKELTHEHSGDIKIAFHAFINPIALLLVTGNILYLVGYILFTSFLYIKVKKEDSTQKQVIMFVNTIYLAIFFLVIGMILIARFGSYLM